MAPLIPLMEATAEIAQTSPSNLAIGLSKSNRELTDVLVVQFMMISYLVSDISSTLISLTRSKSATRLRTRTIAQITASLVLYSLTLLYLASRVKREAQTRTLRAIISSSSPIMVIAVFFSASRNLRCEYI